MSVTVRPFGLDPQGRQADLITISNARGESVSLTSFGAHIVSIKVLDKEGKPGEVCLGQDSAQGYARRDIGYMGGTIGRYANRIGGAAFDMDGKRVQITANEGRNTLHGGKDGFDQKLWAYETGEQSVTMRYTSPHMEEGFPGELKTRVIFSFDDQANLKIEYSAVCDRDTQVNLTNHAYFNLGYGKDILSHTLQIMGNQFLEVDSELIPTGKILPVEGTPFDAVRPVMVGEAWKKPSHPMFEGAKGFDVAYVLSEGTGLRAAAILRAPDSGRQMSVLTDLPGIQCYSGQGLNCTGYDGQRYAAYAGMALETQQHPDTPNHPGFGSARLKAGDEYKTTTVYAFSVK